jgi:poly(3-hydroxybutyrate) depolymerase
MFAACSGGDAKPDDVSEPSNETISEEVTGTEDVSTTVYENCPEGFTSGVLESGQHEGFASSGQERSFYIILPEEMSAVEPTPLIIAFHGTDGSGKYFYESDDLQAFVDAGFIVLALDGNKNGIVWPDWDGLRNPLQQDIENHDLNFFDDALACMQDMFDIDDQRIFILGMSAGGIMTNFVLQRRSDVLAGGIPSSGLIEYTTPVPPTPLGNMAVIVAYGGDNDLWSGTSTTEEEEDPSAKVNFAEQAALASDFYEKEATVNQIYCKGGELGHSWLNSITSWYAQYLLAHPKNNHDNSEFTFESPENTDGTVCDEGITSYESTVVVECDETANQCDSYCQLLGDCAVENATLVAVLTQQIFDLGFAGEGSAECGGCLDACTADLEASVNTSADESVLSCFAGHQAEAECGPGIAGATPAIIAVNDCCTDQAESQVCTRLCTSMVENQPVMNAGVFSACDLWLPEPVDPPGDEGATPPADASSSD